MRSPTITSWGDIMQMVMGKVNGVWLADLLEQSLADERVEKVCEGLTFNADRTQDVVARRDLLDFDRDAELPQSVRDVPGFVRIDDERNAHDRPIRPSTVNVPVSARNQPS